VGAVRTGPSDIGLLLKMSGRTIASSVANGLLKNFPMIKHPRGTSRSPRNCPEDWIAIRTRTGRVGMHLVFDRFLACTPNGELDHPIHKVVPIVVTEAVTVKNQFRLS